MSAVATRALVPLPAPPLPRGRANLVLTGFMGTGKTAVGRIVARLADRPFVDLDEVIAARAGVPVASLIDRDGEAAFRALERAAVRDAARLSGAVIATGGGAPLETPSFAALASTGDVVVLAADPATLLQRIGSGADRPLLRPDPASRIRELLAARDATYRASGRSVDTTGRTADEVARELADAIEPGPARIRVDVPDAAYEVVVGAGTLATLGTALAGALPETTSAVVVADAAVAEGVAARAVASLRDAGVETAGPVGVGPGERAKDVATLERLWSAFRAAGLDRSSAVIAVGGGAALDVAGFAAATYARGLPLVNVPTTLLAMVDAAIGGKVAIDHAGAKNLVGAFHQPRLVVGDPDTLAGLPPAVLREGLAEAVKAVLLASPIAIDLLERRAIDLSSPAGIGWLAEQAIRVKAAYVAADPHDRSLRAALNLGHTYAHALESASGYALSHGDAVAIGLVAAARLGFPLGACEGSLAARLERLLGELGLPTRAPAGIDRSALAAAMRDDKKRHGGRTRFVVPAGDGAALAEVDLDVALAALPR